VIGRAAEPITRSVYKYGLILDTCELGGKTLRKERPGDWGYYCTIAHAVVFGSDVDSRWLRIEFQYFRRIKEAEFTIYESRSSRIGKWTELVSFRKAVEKEGMEFATSETWPVISFENDEVRLKFKFFLEKIR
jgi:hypothetical protein